LGEKIAKKQQALILEHEYQHLKLKHSFDLIVVQCLTLIFWFNPLLYAYRKFLTQVHEFEADQKVLNHSSQTEYINILLNQKFETKDISFVNPFFKPSNLKNRIKMITRSKPSKSLNLKYLLTLPVILFCLFISCTQDDVITNKAAKIYHFDDVYEKYEESRQTLMRNIQRKPSVREILKFYGIPMKAKYTREERKDVVHIFTGLTLSEEYDTDSNYRKSILKEVKDYTDLWNLTFKKSEDYKENGGFISIEENGEIKIE